MSDPVTFTLTQEQYEALIALAAQGCAFDDGSLNQAASLALDAFLRDIEKKNNVTRSLLWVQWQNAREPLPPTARFPEQWPPSLRYRIEFLSRRISRQDVEDVLTQNAHSPVNVLVTPDPAGVVGWKTLDAHFIQP